MRKAAAVSLFLLLLFMAARPVRADDLTIGLVACYDLEESSGSRVDAWSTHDLTDNNTVGSNTGIVGSAADFVAANTEWLSIADNAGMSLGSDSPFTLAAWVYPTSSGSKKVAIDKGTSDGSENNHEFQLLYSELNRFQFNVGDDVGFGSAYPTTIYSINNWYFLVAWHDPDSDTVNLQIDNGTVTSAAWADGTFNSTGDFAIGRRGSNALVYWNGRIDQAVYWKSLVSSDDRTWLYNSGAGRDCAAIAGTVPTPTPTITPTPSPTPTGTPEPTETPTPGPKIEYVDLPGGGRGEIVHSISAGEATIAAVGIVLVMFGAYGIFSQWARAAGSK